jgi:hypothetical protein
VGARACSCGKYLPAARQTKSLGHRIDDGLWHLLASAMTMSGKYLLLVFFKLSAVSLATKIDKHSLQTRRNSRLCWHSRAQGA